jgi:hypothetical protein
MHFAQTLLTLCTAASAVLGAPTSYASSKLESRQTTFNGKSLSILPLGDSITVSLPSTSPINPPPNQPTQPLTSTKTTVRRRLPLLQLLPRHPPHLPNLRRRQSRLHRQRAQRHPLGQRQRRPPGLDDRPDRRRRLQRRRNAQRSPLACRNERLQHVRLGDSAREAGETD